MGEIMTEVLVLRKIFSTEPQQFMLVLQDAMKVQNTEFGAEGKVRSILKRLGYPSVTLRNFLRSPTPNSIVPLPPETLLVSCGRSPWRGTSSTVAI
jgi:hypothetical protein